MSQRKPSKPVTGRKKSAATAKATAAKPAGQNKKKAGTSKSSKKPAPQKTKFAIGKISAERTLSVVMPCLNEAETLEVCIKKARTGIENAMKNGDLDGGEVVIADNGSTDGSQQIAEEAGARVVRVAKKGYGAALIGGIREAAGTYLLMGDADDSYDFQEAPGYVRQLNKGYDLVMGTRLKGTIKPGAMPFLHRYLGNPVLSFLVRLLFGSPISDSHCGLRAFTRKAFDKLKLESPGMEFASEMGINAALLKLKITEIPITLHPDGRSRSPHLRTFRDGWRHLKFMLLYRLELVFGILFLLSLAGLVAAIELNRGPVLSTGLAAITVLWAEFFLWSRNTPFRPGLQKKKTTRARSFVMGRYIFQGGLVAALLAAASFAFPSQVQTDPADMYTPAQWRYTLQMASIFFLVTRFSLGWMRELVRVRLQGLSEFR